MKDSATAHNPAAGEQPVLVVDDNEAGRYALQRVIRAAGFQTLECANGADALAIARKGVAAVVLDVHLPGLSGFDVCRQLRGDPVTANLPIIQVSAIHVGSDDRVTGFAAGADAYYTNPVDPAILVATLESLIRARTQLQVLHGREELYRGAFEHAACALAVLDGEGRIIEANAVFAGLLRLEAQAVLRRSLAGLVPREFTTEVAAALKTSLSSPWRGVFPVITPAGNRVSLEWAIGPHGVPGWCIAVVAPAVGGNTRQPS